jgi:transcriptional regulator with XRE-family HTH domain
MPPRGYSFVMPEERSVTKGFGSRLHQFLDEMKVSQRQVSKWAGVTEASVSRWLDGSIPYPENLKSLAKESGVSFEWLAYGQGSLSPEIKGIDGFIERARKTIIPRLDSIAERLDWIIDQQWLTGTDQEKVWELKIHFATRRGKLVELLRIMEQLPADDVPAIQEALFGKLASSTKGLPLVNDRMALAWLVGVNPAAGDDEILKRCAERLKAADRPEKDKTKLSRKRFTK